ncbi:MAG: hypothetical protein C0167_02930 [Nitrososphaera sp.]|nr:MAG: hypothetical protein C0167_02930 [Nitrososphaera sp.]
MLMSAAVVLEKELKLLMKHVKREVGRALAFGEYGHGFVWAVADLISAVTGVLENAYEMKTAKVPRRGKKCLDTLNAANHIYEAREALDFPDDLHPAAFGYGHALHIFFDVLPFRILYTGLKKAVRCVDDEAV